MLADDLNHLVIREHQLLQSELDQTGVLVNDAVTKLRDNFVNLTQQTNAQTDILSELLNRTENDIDQQERATELKQQINASAMSAVQSLQFEDIIQQLTGHARNRAVQMEQLFGNLAQGLAEMRITDTQQTDQFVQTIKIMQKEVASFREALEKENPVKQETMQAGKIELF